MPKLPGPINVTVTVKEAANAHLSLLALIGALEDEPEEEKAKFNLPLLKRFAIATEMSLKAAGCVFDGRHWRG